MSEFIHGALSLGYLVIALFFLRFWRSSGDRLFLCFALAFAVLGANRISVSVGGIHDEVGTQFYWVRLAAYVLILGAIIDKNLRPYDHARRSG